MSAFSLFEAPEAPNTKERRIAIEDLKAKDLEAKPLAAEDASQSPRHDGRWLLGDPFPVKKIALWLGFLALLGCLLPLPFAYWERSHAINQARADAAQSLADAVIQSLKEKMALGFSFEHLTGIEPLLEDRLQKSRQAGLPSGYALITDPEGLLRHSAGDILSRSMMQALPTLAKTAFDLHPPQPVAQTAWVAAEDYLHVVVIMQDQGRVLGLVHIGFLREALSFKALSTALMPLWPWLSLLGFVTVFFTLWRLSQSFLLSSARLERDVKKADQRDWRYAPPVLSQRASQDPTPQTLSWAYQQQQMALHDDFKKCETLLKAFSLWSHALQRRHNTAEAQKKVERAQGLLAVLGLLKRLYPLGALPTTAPQDEETLSFRRRLFGWGFGLTEGFLFIGMAVLVYGLCLTDTAFHAFGLGQTTLIGLSPFLMALSGALALRIAGTLHPFATSFGFKRLALLRPPHRLLGLGLVGLCLLPLLGGILGFFSLPTTALPSLMLPAMVMMWAVGFCLALFQATWRQRGSLAHPFQSFEMSLGHIMALLFSLALLPNLDQSHDPNAALSLTTASGSVLLSLIPMLCAVIAGLGLALLSKPLAPQDKDHAACHKSTPQPHQTLHQPLWFSSLLAVFVLQIMISFSHNLFPLLPFNRGTSFLEIALLWPCLAVASCLVFRAKIQKKRATGATEDIKPLLSPVSLSFLLLANGLLPLGLRYTDWAMITFIGTAVMTALILCLLQHSAASPCEPPMGMAKPAKAVPVLSALPFFILAFLSPALFKLPQDLFHLSVLGLAGLFFAGYRLQRAQRERSTP